MKLGVWEGRGVLDPGVRVTIIKVIVYMYEILN